MWIDPLSPDAVTSLEARVRLADIHHPCAERVSECVWLRCEAGAEARECTFDETTSMLAHACLFVCANQMAVKRTPLSRCLCVCDQERKEKCTNVSESLQFGAAWQVCNHRFAEAKHFITLLGRLALRLPFRALHSGPRNWAVGTPGRVRAA